MDIIGYEGLYKIYDDGGVFSVRTNKFLKQAIGTHKYYFVILFKNGKSKYATVHSLLAQHYIGERPVGFDIDHIDRNPLNNNLKNLRYISSSDNQRNKYVRGKIPYRHITIKNGFQILITKNYKKVFYKSCRNWTLEDAIRVRNEAYIKLGMEIDDAIRK